MISAKIPNQKETLPRFQDLTKVTGVMRDGKVHAIPYAFNSIGLIYDIDKVKPAADLDGRALGPEVSGARCSPMTTASTTSRSPR